MSTPSPIAADRTKRIREGMSAVLAALPASEEEEFVELLKLIARTVRGEYLVGERSLRGADLVQSTIKIWVELETDYPY